MYHRIFTETWRAFSRDNCMRAAAALAYYTVFSLPPLLVIILQLSGLVYDRSEAQDWITQEIAGVAGPKAANQIRTMVDMGSLHATSVAGTVISVAVLSVGASGAMAQLQQVMNELWSVQPDPEKSSIKYFFTKRVLSFSMILGISFLLVASLIVTVVLTTLSESILPAEWSRSALQAIDFVVNLVMITALFAAIFQVLPDAKVDWRDVWLGAFITALLFIGGKFVLGLYFSKSDVGSAFGAAGSLVLVLAWIYYTGMILLLGAEFTQVYARLYGHGIAPSDGAVRVIQDVHYTRSPTRSVEHDQSES